MSDEEFPQVFYDSDYESMATTSQLHSMLAIHNYESSFVNPEVQMGRGRWTPEKRDDEDRSLMIEMGTVPYLQPMGMARFARCCTDVEVAWFKHKCTDKRKTSYKDWKSGVYYNATACDHWQYYQVGDFDPAPVYQVSSMIEAANAEGRMEQLHSLIVSSSLYPVDTETNHAQEFPAEWVPADECYYDEMGSISQGQEAPFAHVNIESDDTIECFMPMASFKGEVIYGDRLALDSVQGAIYPDCGYIKWSGPESDYSSTILTQAMARNISARLHCGVDVIPYSSIAAPDEVPWIGGAGAIVWHGKDIFGWIKNNRFISQIPKSSLELQCDCPGEWMPDNSWGIVCICKGLLYRQCGKVGWLCGPLPPENKVVDYMHMFMGDQLELSRVWQYQETRTSFSLPLKVDIGDGLTATLLASSPSTRTRSAFSSGISLRVYSGK